MEDIRETLRLILVYDPKERSDLEDIMSSHWLVSDREVIPFDVEGYEGCELYTLPELGRGASGIVYKGELPSGKPVAVKRILQNYFKTSDPKYSKTVFERNRRRILNEELNVLKRLQKVGCENVIKFYGWYSFYFYNILFILFWR